WELPAPNSPARGRAAQSGQRCDPDPEAEAAGAERRWAEPTSMRSRLRSMVDRPMPLTIASSSALLNGPLAARWATISSALDGPTLTSTRARVSASAVLMLTLSLAAAQPSISSDSSRLAKTVLNAFMVLLLGVWILPHRAQGPSPTGTHSVPFPHARAHRRTCLHRPGHAAPPRRKSLKHRRR